MDGYSDDLTGGGRRARTADLWLAKPALSQLSYTPGLTATFIPDRQSRGKWIPCAGSDQEDGPLFFGAFLFFFPAAFFTGALAAIGKEMAAMTSRTRSAV